MKNRGFTLIELLVVIAIIAVLMAILLPSLSYVRNVAQRVICGTRLNDLNKGLNMYVVTYETLPLWESKRGNVLYSHHFTGSRRHGNSTDRDDMSSGYWYGIGALYGAGAVDSPRAFYCPATEGWREEIASQPQPWGSSGGGSSFSPRISKGYLYWPLSKGPNMTAAEYARISGQGARGWLGWDEGGGLPKATETPHDVNPSYPIVFDNTFHAVKGSGWNINALYMDGSVRLVRQPHDHADGLGMWHERNPFPSGVMEIVAGRYTWRDNVEQARNKPTWTGMTRYVISMQ